MSLIIPEIFEDTTYSIEVVNMKTTTHLGVPNIVTLVKYRLTSSYEDKAITSEHEIGYNVENITSVEDFTEFNLLTEEEVIGWIESNDAFTYLRYSQADQIQYIVQQASETTNPPWLNS